MNRQKLLTTILVLGILFLIPAAFAADTLIRNTVGDLEISTKTTDGGGVHVRSRQTGTGLFLNTSNNVGIGTTVPGNFDGWANKLVVGTGSGQNGLTVYSGNLSGEGGHIFFADGQGGALDQVGRISYIHSSDAMQLWTNDTLRLTIDSVGNVGIGAVPTTNRLHVLGNVHATGNISADGNLTANVSAAQVSAGTFGSVAGKGNYRFDAAASASAILYVDATNQRVGIGTIAPAAPLHASSTADQLRLTNTGVNWDFGSKSNGDLAITGGSGAIYFKNFSANNSTRVGSTGELNVSSTVASWFSGGNVGIGDTTPAAMLTVGSGDLFQVNSGGIVRGPNGSAVAPTYSFTGPNSSGMYYDSIDGLSFSASGARKLSVGTASVHSTINISTDGNFLGSNGTISAPAHSFIGSTGTGTYWSPALGNFGFSVSGFDKMWIRSGVFETVTILSTEGAPVFSVYRSAATASGNIVVEHKYDGRDAVGSRTSYARIVAVAEDVTDASEDGSFRIETVQAGTLTEHFKIASGGQVQLANCASTCLLVGGGTGKIDAGTIDPVYTILGKRYATYMAGMTGLKEETTGVFKLQNKQHVIDFNKLEEGSDLWLFAQTVNVGGRSFIAEDGRVYRTTAEELFDNMTVLLTPGFDGRVWYEKDVENKRITVFADKSGEVSYRLTAPRFDWKSWSNRSDAEHEGFNLDNLLE